MFARRVGGESTQAQPGTRNYQEPAKRPDERVSPRDKFLKNHFHLALRIKDVELLPDKLKQKPYLAFSNMFNSYSKAINKAYNRQGSLFQEHLHRIRVEDDEYLMQLIAYIHLNPVKHEFTEYFKNYRYSSYQAYVSEKNTSIEKSYVMSLFGDITNFEYWHDLNKLYLEDKMQDI